MKDLAGIVLAGGKSQRMGRPKALLPFGDELLLQRVVRRLEPACSPIVVVRAEGQTLPSLPAHVLVATDPVEGRGPLQGIAAGLSLLAGVAEAAFVSSTDAPFVDPQLARRLGKLRGDAFDCVVPRALGHYHPLAAVYACAVLPAIEELLAEDRLRPFFLFESVRTRFVGEEELSQMTDPSLRALRNVNTPEELEDALAEAARAGDWG